MASLAGPSNFLSGWGPVGLGLAAIGRPAYITVGRSRDLGADRSPRDLAHRADEVLDEAWSAGIRYFDVARSYGLAESFLASWLERRGISPDDLVVGSKWGYEYTGDWRLDSPV